MNKRRFLRTFLPNSDTQTPTRLTPKPTSTRRPATAMLMPTPTAQAFIISSNPDEPECDLPEFFEETKIGTTSPSFCIVWLDEFDDEQGFQIHLTYFGDSSYSHERFVYEVEANVTQLIVPEAHAPRLVESLEQCMSRKNYMIEVVAFWPDSERRASSFGLNNECGGPGGTPLPTATHSQ